MFRSSSESAKTNFREVKTPAECESLLGDDLAIVFKHSSSCGTSWMAHREMVRFQQMRPHAPIVLISVLNNRSLSRYVSDRFAIEHESPQVLVVRKNELVAARSHDDITLEFLLQFVDEA